MQEPVMTDLAVFPPPVPPRVPPPPIPPPLPPAPSLSPPPIPLQGTVICCFTGAMEMFRSVILRGALLQVVTFGLYRFWLTTDARRFLWANTEVGGDSLEYTGTAMELFLGFLIAIALLVPVYVLLFIGTLELGLWSQLSSLAAFVFLAVFGQYAYYRARRYRLTRTVFRGVRFHQSGSPFVYALRSLLWWIVTALTFGLAYPWAQASLERYKLAHTHFGEWQGKFAGTGTKLFVRGIALWVLLIAASAAVIAIGTYFIDLKALTIAAKPGGANNPEVALEGLKIMGLGFGLMIIGGFVYIVLQAIMLRWWLEGLRVGPLDIATTLRKRNVCGAYLRYIGYAMLLSTVLSFVMGMVIGIVAVSAKAAGAKPGEEVAQGLFIAATAGMYLVMAIGMWVLYQITIKLRIWRLAIDSLAVAGFQAIAQVRADASQPSSAVGEGLADALGAGGI